MVSIIKNPHDEKFRLIKKSNPAIQKKLLGIKASAEVRNLILALGYIEMDSEHYVFVGDYFTVLLLGQGATEHALNLIKARHMTPEERKRAELIEQQRLLGLEELKKR